MDLPTDSRDFPPYVRKYLVEARQLLAQEQTAPIVVTSEPSGCAVRIMGSKLGNTAGQDDGHGGRRFQQDNPARRATLIQVECGEGKPGRVHTITPGDETPPLHVDTVFESAVSTQGGILRLSYETDNDSHVGDHALRVAQALGAPMALAINYQAPERLKLTRYGAGPTASVVVHTTFTQLEVEDALAKLLAQSAVAAKELEPSSEAQGQSAPARREDEAAFPWTTTLTATSAVAGAGALATSWWLYSRRKRDGQLYRSTLVGDPAYLSRGQAWVDARKGPYLAAALGTTALTAGTTLLAFRYAEHRLPWWAYSLSAAAGTGLAVWGIGEIARGGPCDQDVSTDRRYCVLGQEQRDKGALLIFSAAPLLVTPILHLAFRSADKPPPIAVNPSLSRGSFQLRMAVGL